MPDAIQTIATPLSVHDLIAATCKKIPPLWDLPNYVAVNPFMGFANKPVATAAREIADGLGARVLPNVAWYRARWQEGAFGSADLHEAARRMGHDPAALRAILSGSVPVPTRQSTPVLTFAERHDLRHGTTWNDTLLRSLTRWCAVEVSGAGAHWAFDTDGTVRYATWREAAAIDRSLEIAGVAGWRQWVASLPRDAETTVADLLERLAVPDDEREAYLYRLLGGIFGFASYVRRGPWEAGDDDHGPLAELLAIRVAADAAIPTLLHGGNTIAADVRWQVEDEAIRLVLQEALEEGYARRLLGALRPPPKAKERPAVQAVFCIDVRSEPFRRHLETLDEKIETRGFAGFFGVFLNWQVDGASSARCPVLFKPSAAVRAGRVLPPGLIKRSVKHAQQAPSASFSFVELAGLLYGLGMAGDALARRKTWHPTEGTDTFALDRDAAGAGIDAEGRAAIAAGILKNMCLRNTTPARLVLLCGHEGRSANNPHMAGLDCGACGGHGGAINARVAAAILNDAGVRKALKADGWKVPDDTWFVPGVHDTSTDRVTLFDTDRVPHSHTAELARLRQWLAAAGEGVRAERAAALGLGGQPAQRLERLLDSRAEDWSEVRPEWALARNAAFIAARRGRTLGLNLDGRSFLHEYDADADPDDAVLTLILIAPMVVASWINLQYFGSTVDNDIFGCGNKTLHNRVGGLGVVVGNGGDLRTGLARQSVHAPDGSWFHEPMRLQVVIEAACDRIDAVLDQHPGVRDLIENGWVRLVALCPTSTQMWRRLAGGVWEPAISLTEAEAA